jgi:hypothetical protein
MTFGLPFMARFYKQRAPLQAEKCKDWRHCLRRADLPQPPTFGDT